jgi:hypothetical protein
MTTQTNLPAKIDFNEKMVTGPSTPQYVDDLYQGVIVRLTQAKCPFDEKKMDIGFEVAMRAVNAAGDAAGPTITKWFGVPVGNPAVTGHFVSRELRTIPNTDRKTSDYEQYIKDGRDLMIAVGKTEGLPNYPKKKEGTDTYIDPDTGDVMDQAAQKVRRKEIQTVVLKQLLEWYNQASDEVPDSGKELLAATLFFKTKQKNDYARVSYVTSNRNGEAYRTEDFFGTN